MTRLSVNINKIATLRNARGGNLPDLLQFAQDCERFGADGITVHPRPDERHITRNDALLLRDVISKEYNIEGYPDERYFEILREAKPDQATLVPDGPNVLTSSEGWDIRANFESLKDWIDRIHQLGIRSSLFVSPEIEQIELAAEVGAQRIEFYTGPFAQQFISDPSASVTCYSKAADAALRCGLGINAGHDLNLENLRYFREHVPGLLEVSIGHALISDALYYGIENTIYLYKRCLNP